MPPNSVSFLKRNFSESVIDYREAPPALELRPFYPRHLSFQVIFLIFNKPHEEFIKEPGFADRAVQGNFILADVAAPAAVIFEDKTLYELEVCVIKRDKFCVSHR